MKSSVVLAGVASSTVALAAEPTPVMAKNQSPHFNAVASQLEMGGLSFSYHDSASRISLMKGLIREVVKYLDNNTPLKGADAKALGDAFAIDAVKASGRSASQRDGHVHYRMFNYMPEAKSAMARAYGGDEPSVALQLAPSGADLVLEIHMNGSSNPELENKIFAALGPMGEMLKSQMEEAMKSKPESKVMKDFLAQLNSRISFVGDLSPKGFNAQKGFPVSGEFLVSMTNAEDTWKLLRAEIEASGDKVTTEGDFEVSVSPEEVTGWVPVLRYDTKSKQLFGATSAEYLELCFKASRKETPSLAEDPEFVKVRAGLPKSFSTMAYVSPKFAKTALNLSLFAIPQIPDENVRPAVQQLVNLLRESEVTKTATVYAGSVLDNGELHIVNSPVNVPHFASSPTTTAGAALVGVSALFTGASYYRDNANNAACVINQSSITKGAESYYNITNEEATWQKLVSPQGPFANNAPLCPTNGTYKLVPQGDGSYSVDCSCGATKK